MITIGIYDELKLRLQCCVTQLKTYSEIDILFQASDSSVLSEKLQACSPNVLIILSTFADDGFLKIIRRIKHHNLKVIVINTQLSQSLIPNLKEFDISGYLLMETESPCLLEAIIRVNNGKFYCCQEVSDRILELNKSRSMELTEREKDVIRLLIKDKSSKEIAEALHISNHTVSSHRASLRKKFNVNSSAGMIKKALDSGFV